VTGGGGITAQFPLDRPDPFSVLTAPYKQDDCHCLKMVQPCMRGLEIHGRKLAIELSQLVFTLRFLLSLLWVAPRRRFAWTRIGQSGDRTL